ncbi:cytochrome c553 [Paucibacter oligotrophus]|uniref:Cytochrome c553 n=1 Tax=Roseateles oligotrophus TaxID=1769250 RepID=A0A840L9D5_9BURK|nr:c-type cytochrome [Roseateles oligotrophus]MBB4844706.1 cytochrome c553 [Roseateles oligotrophus]
MTPWPALYALSLLLLSPAALATPAAPVKVEDSIAQRAQACTLCHGKQGRAAADGYYPRLAGKPQGYLYKQLLNFRDGRRHYGLMSDLLAPLSDAYLHELAGYFAALALPYPPPQTPSLPPEALARGRQLVLHGDAARKLPACVQCHGEQLSGVQPFIPGLLSLPRDYLNGQLGAWRSGQRRALAPDCMAQIAKTLKEDEINAISQWLAAQALPPGAKPAQALPTPLPLDCGGLQP